MHIRDNFEGYGLVTRLFHWLFAVAILALFAMGWWMTGLDYYSPYYNSGPYLHKAAGIILLILLVPRFVWRLMNPKPGDAELKPLERKASALVHWGFYPLLLLLMVSGYLIPTAKGQAIDVFGMFNVPSVLAYEGLAERAGLVHEILAYMTMGLAGVHAAAALKHHYSGKSRILTRMWSGPPAN